MKNPEKEKDIKMTVSVIQKYWVLPGIKFGIWALTSIEKNITVNDGF